jgi:streptogramin lyase
LEGGKPCSASRSEWELGKLGSERRPPVRAIRLAAPVLVSLALVGAVSSPAQAAHRHAVEFAIPTPISSPVGIVTGPDGNLWFTELGANKIGRTSTDGKFTEFPLPRAGADPQDIAAGPDGNLWFTETPGAIGRIATDGTLTEFPVPDHSDFPFTIAP